MSLILLLVYYDSAFLLCFVIYWGNGESPLSLKIETRLHINKALLLSTAKQLFEVTRLRQYVFHVFHWVCKMLVRQFSTFTSYFRKWDWKFFLFCVLADYFLLVVYIDSYLQWCYNLQTKQNYMLVKLHNCMSTWQLLQWYIFSGILLLMLFCCFFFSVAECQEDGCSWHNWPWGTWDVPHRGSGDRGLCQSYDDSQSGSMGFTSNLLNWLKNSCCCFCCCFLFSQSTLSRTG